MEGYQILGEAGVRPLIRGNSEYPPTGIQDLSHHGSVTVETPGLFAWFETLNFCVGKFVVLAPALEVAAKQDSSFMVMLFDPNAYDHAHLILAQRKLLNKKLKCSLDAIGGGWMAVDRESRRIIIYGKSIEFGVEPCRDALIERLRTAMPAWDILRQ